MILFIEELAKKNFKHWFPLLMLQILCVLSFLALTLVTEPSEVIKIFMNVIIVIGSIAFSLFWGLWYFSREYPYNWNNKGIFSPDLIQAVPFISYLRNLLDYLVLFGMVVSTITIPALVHEFM